MLKKLYATYKNLLSSEYVAQNPSLLKKHVILYFLSEIVNFIILCVVLTFLYYLLLSFFPDIVLPF